MSPGSTRTGGVLEDMVLPALRHGGYQCKVQTNVGKRLGLGAHKVDCIATKEGRAVLISVKRQQVSGTAEQKVPFAERKGGEPHTRGLEPAERLAAAG